MIGRRRAYKPSPGPQFVQYVGRSFTDATNVSSRNLNPLAATKQGNDLIAFVKYGGGSLIQATALTDTQSNTWTPDHQYSPGSGATVNVFRCHNAKALGTGDTITATAQSAQGYWGVIVVEVSTITALDETAHAASLPGTTVTTNQSTQTTAAQEIAFTMFAEGGSPPSGTTYSVSSGWTQVGAGDTADPASCAVAYQMLTAQGTQTSTWTSPNNANCTAAILTYR